MRTGCLAVVALFLLLPVYAEDDPARKLKQIEAQLGKTPKDPMLLYRKARCLMTLGQREKGYRTAKVAMACFAEKGNDLAWIILERIELGHIHVDVHFNMGPRERRPPETGIMRPLSFRIWAKGEEDEAMGRLLEVIDFEIGMSEGKPSTAALGQTTRRGHANFGMLDTDAAYTEIRQRLIGLVKKRHKAPNNAGEGDKP